MEPLQVSSECLRARAFGSIRNVKREIIMTSLNQTGFQFLLYRYIKKQAREVHAMAAIVK